MYTTRPVPHCGPCDKAGGHINFTVAVHQFLKTHFDRGESGRVLPHAELTLDDSNMYPTCKMRVVNGATGQSADLVTRRSFARHAALSGRGTCAYLAYGLHERRLVFLKDLWRAKDRHLRSEFDVYQELRLNDVPFIPDMIYGGDVPP